MMLYFLLKEIVIVEVLWVLKVVLFYYSYKSCEDIV